MKTTFSVRISFLLSLAALTVLFSGLSARAETVDSATARSLAAVKPQSLCSPATQTQSHSATTPAASSVNVKLTKAPIPGTAMTSASALRAGTSKKIAPALAQTDGTTPGTTTPGTPVPIPTTPSTTPSTTPGNSAPSQTTPENTTPGTPTTPANSAPTPTTPGTTTPGPNEVVPGRATRSGPSYIGIGPNIGISGDTALGNTNFTIMSKIGLTRNLSVRPAAVTGGSTMFLLPITLDFPFQAAGTTGYSIAPYLGAGAAISTGRGPTGRLLLTGGVDIPITGSLTATAGVNAAIINRTDVGLLIGIGYNFPGF